MSIAQTVANGSSQHKARPLSLIRQDRDVAAHAGAVAQSVERAGPPVASDQPSVHPDHRVFATEEWSRLGKLLALSPRELEVAQRIFDDLREAEIAERLGISPHTVHTHIERLYRKAGVASRSALVIVMLFRLRLADAK